MKKILLLLFALLLLTGCSKIDRDTTDYKNIVNFILNSNNHNVNTASVGYKYYVPIGIDVVSEGDFNKEFKYKNNRIVLYVDIISYYYGNTLNYNDVCNECYYFDRINGGYIYIDEISDNEYFLKIVYNYSKIESYVNKSNLIDVISYSTIILNSISYNDVMIDNLLTNGAFSSTEIDYEIVKPDDSESKFSQYLQEYVQDVSDEEVTDELPSE